MSTKDDTVELTRQVGETFSLGENIIVRFLGIEGSRVRLGIEAPRSVMVKRAETQGRDGSGPARAGAHKGRGG